MKVTIYDVANHANVGIGTVSRVLNGHSHVKDETRKKVLEAIKILGYSPQGSARALARQQTHLVAVMIPHFNGYFFMELLKGIQTTLCTQGYQIILSSVDHPEKVEQHLQQLVENRRVDGLILCSMGIPDAFVETFKKLKLKVVLVDSFHKSLDSIVVDNRDGAYQATKSLIEKGHTHIGIITGTLASFPAKKRLQGFLKALKDYRIPFDKKNITACKVITCADGFSKESGYLAMKRILSNGQPLPTAFFVTSDEQAAGVILALQEAGLRVPEDVSIIGFDDVEIAEYLGLTTMRQPINEIGKAAAQLLLERISAKSSKQSVQYISYKTKLIARNSCRCLSEPI